MRTIDRLALIFAIGVCGSITPVHAATYYVVPPGSTTGSQSAAVNSAVAENTFTSVSTGVSALSPGDTLVIKSGVYDQSSPLDISQSDITVTADTTDGPAVLTGSTVNVGGSGTTLNGMEVTGVNGYGINISGSNNTVTNCNVHHNQSTGIYSGGANNTISNNTVWRNAESNYCGGGPNRECAGDWAAGIAWGSTHTTSNGGNSLNVRVLNNRVYNNSGEGVICMHNGQGSATDWSDTRSGGLIQGNLVYDNWAQNIYLDQCSHVTIDRNVSYYSPDQNWWRKGSPRGNINLSNETINGDQIPTSHVIITNNIATGGGTNIGMWVGFISNPHLDNVLIANNTIFNPRGSNLGLDGNNAINTSVHNNIVINTGGGSQVSGGSGVTFSHNLWSGGAGKSGTGDVSGDPKLVNLGGSTAAGAVDPAWYQLTSGSPAINAGQALAQVTTDFWGNARGSSPDIGAHEYGGSVNPTTQPSPTGASGKTADGNGDNRVDGQDYVIWLNHYGQSASGAANGDYTKDGKVDGQDYVAWLNNYGK